MNGTIRIFSSLYWWGVVFGHAGYISIATYVKGTSMCLCDVYAYIFMHNVSKVPHKIICSSKVLCILPNFYEHFVYFGVSSYKSYVVLLFLKAPVGY